MTRMVRLAAVSALALAAASPALAGKADDTLNFAIPREVSTLDEYYNLQAEVTLLTNHIYSHLLWRDPYTLEIKPGLATDWRWIDDTTLEFDLREGVTFHNGEVFNADDVVYTVEFALSPEANTANASTRYGHIASAEKVDDYTVRLHMTGLTPTAVERAATLMPILPNDYHAAVGAERFGREPVGTGPYRVVSFEQGGRIELERFENAYEAAWGKARIGRINILPVTDPQAQVAELITGGLDILWRVVPDQAERLEPLPGISTASSPALRTFFIQMDASGRAGESPLTDRRVRQAINHAINRESIVRNLVKGAAFPIYTACNPQQFGCTTDVQEYPYDPGRARALLAEAGHPDGVTLELSTFGPENRPVIEAVIGDLAAVGITVNLDFRELGAWIPKFQGGEAQMALLAWASYGLYDASGFVGNFFLETPGDYSRDPELVEWFTAAQQTIDTAEREALYARGLQKIAAEAYVAPLYVFSTFYAHRDELAFTPPQDGVLYLYLLDWAE